MNYALIGPEDRRKAFIQQVAVMPAWHGEIPPENLSRYEVIIDLGVDEHPERVGTYASLEETLVIGSAVKMSLAELLQPHCANLRATFFGLNALPTFLEREVWEVSVYQEDTKEQLAAWAKGIGKEIQLVHDQVGMVTPRILFMIINEAYVVMQEGTADAAAIDQAMRFGTNYPQGPVAWSEEIGLAHIVAVLDKLQQETGESRYRVAPLLRRKMRLHS
ncbi:MAG: 3-hydroxyacyl-CoA dehydrogenase family protein [Bacteroidota bacterium]